MTDTPRGTDLTRQDAASLRRLFVEGDVSAREIAAAFLERIEATEPALGAFLAVAAESAGEDADALDRRLAAGETPGPLAGVPVAVKDILCVEGLPTTCGSRILEGFVPPYDATCVARLRRAGAIVIGKTNMDEFAMGSSTEHSARRPTRNPYDLDRVPGGSSGGSAAAVAARQAPLAIGSDTGGSIRQPGAFTGTVALKPTYGRVSRYGLVAFASSLDQAGPFAATVLDCAQALAVMAGPDAADMTCSPIETGDYVSAATGGGRPIEGLRVGIPREFFGDGLDPEIDAAVRRCHEILRRGGATVTEISLPTTGYAIATYYVIATAEASSNLARYDGVRYGARHPDVTDLADMYDRTRAEGLGDEVRRRIMLGTYVLSAGYYDAYYLKAMKVRTLIRRDFERAFRAVDVIVGPTTPTPPFRLGEKMDDPLAMYLSDIYTVTANLAGIPGLSLPCGFTRSGLPIGCQILGSHFDETTVFSTAAALESALGVREQAPPLAAGL